MKCHTFENVDNKILFKVSSLCTGLTWSVLGKNRANGQKKLKSSLSLSSFQLFATLDIHGQYQDIQHFCLYVSLFHTFCCLESASLPCKTVLGCGALL